MKVLVALLGEYFPYFTPNSKIGANVLDEIEDDYRIIILSMRCHFSTKTYEKIGKYDVYRINSYNELFQNFFKDKYSENKAFGWKAMLQITRCINYFFRIFRLESISYGYIRRLMKKLEQINATTPIDLLFPVSAPHENIVAAKRFKRQHHNIGLFPYKLDRFAIGNSLYENQLIRHIRYPRHIDEEINTLILCDKLFILNPLKNYYEEEIFEEYHEKIITTEHPLLKNKCVNQENKKSEYIDVVYAGSLDTKLRNPKFLLDVFKDIKSDVPIKLNMYSFGNCENLVEKYETIVPERIIRKGKVSSVKIDSIIKQADILVTIGNNSTEEVPSKLFEYLSYGKPIIHFWFYDKDPYLEYLEKYPLAKCIKVDFNSICDATNSVCDFCINNTGKLVPFEVIKTQFGECLPEYVAKLITLEFDKSINRHNIIVAHPNQQHSFRLSEALKRENYLHTFLTTSFITVKRMRIVSLFVREPFLSKFRRKGNKNIEPLVETKYKFLGLLYYVCLRISNQLSCRIYPILCNKFGQYVAKYAIEQNCTAVIMFDYTAYSCFKYLKEHAPQIIRILDMSSIPAKDIDEILCEQEKNGRGIYFIKNRRRYKKEYCELSEKELEYANYFFTPSGYVKGKLSKRKYITEGQIITAEYGIDLTSFRFIKRDFECDTLNLVFVGRIEGPKGILVLIETCDRLFEKHKNFVLNLIGPNYLDDDIVKRPYIKFYGFLNKEQLINTLGKMHLFVLPSLWEGKSQSTLEAISTGLPVVVSDSCGVDEIINKSQVGYVYSGEDELYNILDRIIDNRNALKQMSENTKECQNSITWSDYNLQVQNGIEYILGDRYEENSVH